MTTYSMSEYVTALELARHVGPDGSLFPIIQALSVQIPIFADVHQEMCNDGTGHQGVTEYYQPTGTWRGYNEGVAAEAPISADFREPTAQLASRFQADRDLLIDKARGDLSKAAILRARMLGQFSAGMVKKISNAMLYGQRLDGKSPLGLTRRSDYNTLSSAYVHDNAGGAASATANKTSLWILGHGSAKYHWIYPQGIAPPEGVIAQPGQPIRAFGLRIDALPDDLVLDIGGSNQFLAVRNWVTARCGHAIEDARYVQRVCNISTSNVDGVDDFSINEDYIIDALAAMPDQDDNVIYVNKTVHAQITKRCKDKGNVWHNSEDPFAIGTMKNGKPKVSPFFDTTPVHIWESIVDTEAKVT